LRKMLSNDAPKQLYGKLVEDFQTEEHAIRLYQLDPDIFAVQYGKQMDHSLTYAQAAQKLGEALMHSLAMTGAINVEG
jgi:hypothetical protein